MTDRLRELLVEAAEDAPRVDPADGTWRRARRARVRDLVVVPAALLVIVVLVGLSTVSLVSTTQGGFEPVEGEQPAPALPDRLYAVPHWAEPSQDGLDVGPLGIVWTQARLDTVVGVSATTGEYVLLDLPNYVRRTPFEYGWQRSLALSPDGTRLAYSWVDISDAEDRTVSGGIAIADLTTSTVDTHALPLSTTGRGWRGYSSRPEELRWSVDGERLSFRLDAVRWKPGRERMSIVARSAGAWHLLDAATGEVTRWDKRSMTFDQAVAPAGDGASLLAATSSAIVKVAPEGASERVAALRPFQAVRDLMWTEHGIVVSEADTWSLVGPGDRGGDGLPGLSLSGRRTLLAASSEAVASVGPSRSAVLGISPLSPGSSVDSRQIRLFGDAHPPGLRSLSVAAVALDAEPREASEPDWGLSPQAKQKLVWVGLGLGAVVAMVVGLWWGVRRWHASFRL